MKKIYYTEEEVTKGIIEDGIELIPPIGLNTLRKSRREKKLKFHKNGYQVLYTIEDLKEFLSK